MDTLPDLLTTEGAARELGCSRRRVQYLISRGQLPTVDVCGRRLVTAAAVEAARQAHPLDPRGWTPGRQRKPKRRKAAGKSRKKAPRR